MVYDITGENSNSLKSRTPDNCFREQTVARTLDTFSGSPECNQGGNVVVFDARGNGDGQIVPTITGDHENRVTDYTALAVGNGQLSQIYMTDTAGTLTCSHDQQMICAFWGGQGAKAGGIGYSETVSPTLKAAPSGNNTVPDIAYWLKRARRYFVRRFTPLECCRLQGFPDWWEDGVDGSDSARYKMHKAIEHSMPLTSTQARMLNAAIKERAAAVKEKYALGDEARLDCMREIRKKLYRRWAVASVKEIPRSEYELALETVERFDESAIALKYI